MKELADSIGILIELINALTIEKGLLVLSFLLIFIIFKLLNTGDNE